MAKDKEFEKRYLEIKLADAVIRRQNRTIKHRMNKRDRGQECPHCFRQMSWCSTCEMWSSDCCEEYGTC